MAAWIAVRRRRQVPARLIRKLLVRGVLAAVGGALGVAIAAIALPMLIRLAPSNIPRLDHVRLDTAVLLFALGAVSVSALMFGLVPAFRYTRVNVLAALRHGGRSSTDTPVRHRGRNLLVVVQTAMSLILLVGSCLMARSFSKLMATEVGFESKDVLTFRVGLPAPTYPKSEDVARFGQAGRRHKHRSLPSAAGAIASCR